MTRTLVTLDVPGELVPTIVPRINGAYSTPAGQSPRTALLGLHPTSSFLDHYLLGPLASRGYGVLGLNGRFVNNQAAIRAELLLLDINTGVRYLRSQGVERVVLIGNSLGGSLMCLYQSQAESPGAAPNRYGEALPSDLSLAPADGLVLTVAPVGPGHVMAHFLDPSVLDEADPWLADPDLDMFNPANGPPYSRDWLQRYRSAQMDRNRRISGWARSVVIGGGADVAFVVHRTSADPRFLDATIDPSDRPVGSGFGDAAEINRASIFYGRHSTARTWLSLWSYEGTHMDGPRHLPHTTCPVLFITHSADQICFSGDQAPYFKAVGPQRLTHETIRGGNHTLLNQPDKVEESAGIVSRWLHGHGFAG